jgi:hypothetical protein
MAKRKKKVEKKVIRTMVKGQERVEKVWSFLKEETREALPQFIRVRPNKAGIFFSINKVKYGIRMQNTRKFLLTASNLTEPVEIQGRKNLMARLASLVV